MTSSPDSPAQYAKVCSPERVVHWSDSDFILRKIINPICHGISIIILLIIAIIYFVLPTLRLVSDILKIRQLFIQSLFDFRDLVGNIITTITICLIISQAANLVRIFTEFSNHISFIVVDSILYFGLLGAFFWLNCLGYYIWKTFR